MNTKPLIPVSIGELFDKVSILEIKLVKIKDDEKNANIRTELHSLYQVLSQFDKDKVFVEYKDLKKVNETLWDIEDKLRVLEKTRSFGDDFISAARGVYYTNDRRSELKRIISEKLGSHLVEEKLYQDYKRRK